MDTAYSYQSETTPLVLPYASTTPTPTTIPSTVPSNVKFEYDDASMESNTAFDREGKVISDALNGRAVALYILLASLLTLSGLGYFVFSILTHS